MDDAKLLEWLAMDIGHTLGVRMRDDFNDGDLPWRGPAAISVEPSEMAAGLRKHGLRLEVEFKFTQLANEDGEQYDYNEPAPGICGREPEDIAIVIEMEKWNFDR